LEQLATAIVSGNHPARLSRRNLDPRRASRRNQ
jgi:hypothetical protein